MRIFYLYAELMGYQVSVIREYVRTYAADVHLVHWDHKKLTPYAVPQLAGVTLYNRSEYTSRELIRLADELAPDIAFISGWQDRGYLAAAARLRKKGVPVVSGFDDQWTGTLRQVAGSLVMPFVLRRYFSHGWVTGPYQYEFARRIGFPKRQIVFNCYSADVELFNRAYLDSKEAKRTKYPHRFLYAGRFEQVKGIDLLVKAWEQLAGKKKDWELFFIGNGSQAAYLSEHRGISVLEFLQPEDLVSRIRDFGCFVLPSRSEPWAVVLHEFSAAGLPVICSDVCGAAPVFVTPGSNGYLFRSGDVSSLERQMMRIIDASDEDLLSMSSNAHNSGQKITPRISAASFLSVLYS